VPWRGAPGLLPRRGRTQSPGLRTRECASGARRWQRGVGAGGSWGENRKDAGARREGEGMDAGIGDTRRTSACHVDRAARVAPSCWDFPGDLNSVVA
jgi:hypothetical protein